MRTETELVPHCAREDEEGSGLAEEFCDPGFKGDGCSGFKVDFIAEGGMSEGG